MPERSMGAALTWLAEREPDRVAVRVVREDGPDVVVTRAELDARADALARTWLAGGLRPEDLVTIALANADAADLVVACAAAWKAGATPQPLAPTTPARERERLLEVARPAVVVDGPLAPPSPDDVAGLPALDPDAAAGSWKVATSSGSTGTPKLIRASAPARVDPLRQVTSFLPLDAVQLVSGPITHGAPFVYATRGLLTGHELVVLPRFEPGAWLRAVEQHRVTWTMLVPTTMQRIWRDDARSSTDVSSLTGIVHLGAACAPWLKRAWIDWLGPDRVTEVYAGTESQGLTVITGAEWLEHPGSVGRASGGSSFVVRREDGSECDPGETGEVLMRRASSSSSYLGSAGGSGDPDGWHSLGDLGHLDDEGYLYLAGRADDVITCGGVSVLPAPVEAVLEEHPDVRSALLVGRPDGDTGDLGERLHAVVDTAGADVTESDLVGWVRDRLDPEQRPRSWQLVDQLLRDDAGKARRRDWAVEDRA